jgi:hypothetical protein
MAHKKDSKAISSLAPMMVAILCLIVGCLPAPPPTGTPTASPSSAHERAATAPIPDTATPPLTSAPAPIPSKATPAPTNSPENEPATPTPVDRWSELAQRTPYPYSTPLPAAETTVLDGIYTKADPRQADHIPCKRCPAYPPGGGVWKLSLDKGIFRVYHQLTGWVTIGSFAVAGDQIEFFNDPHCFQDTGVYRWRLDDGSLTLTTVEDDCGVYLRAQNLEAFPWESCQPPSTEAAITNHWPVPPGCESE